MTLANDASVILFGLAHGYLVPQDAIAWADQAIVRSVTASEDLVAVSLSPPSAEELKRRLQVVAGTFTPRPETRAVLESMKAILAVHPERAASMAYALVQLFTDDEAAREAHHVDYAFELAESGAQGTHEAALAELQSLLDRRTA